MDNNQWLIDEKPYNSTSQYTSTESQTLSSISKSCSKMNNDIDSGYYSYRNVDFLVKGLQTEQSIVSSKCPQLYTTKCLKTSLPHSSFGDPSHISTVSSESIVSKDSRCKNQQNELINSSNLDIKNCSSKLYPIFSKSNVDQKNQSEKHNVSSNLHLTKPSQPVKQLISDDCQTNYHHNMKSSMENSLKLVKTNKPLTITVPSSCSGRKKNSGSPKNKEHSNEPLASDALSLAEKIEFCMKFGYTTPQIRAALKKLNCKATKNDILSELFKNSSSQSQTKQTTADIHTSSDHHKSVKILQEHTYPLSNGLLARGPDTPLATLPQSKQNDLLSKTSLEDDSCNLRPIVIDGSNVAMSHGNKNVFSCKGILLAVNYFKARNHQDITVFVPNYRKESSRPDATIEDREILDKLEYEKILVYTPSRCINGRRVTCYDDRFILRLAQETEGVIVSNDHFRDLQNEKPEWKELIEKRLLMYSFVNDRFMPPDDPLGRNGPGLNNFLRKRPAAEEKNRPQCPYGRKCTFGKKCKYFHPECSMSYKSVTDRLKEKSERNKEPSNMAKSLAKEIVCANTTVTHLKEHLILPIDKTYVKDTMINKFSKCSTGFIGVQDSQNRFQNGSNLNKSPQFNPKTSSDNSQSSSPSSTNDPSFDSLPETMCKQMYLSSKSPPLSSGKVSPPKTSSFDQRSFPDSQRLHHSFPSHHTGARLSTDRDCHSDGLRHLNPQQQQHITIHQYPTSQLAFNVASTSPYGITGPHLIRVPQHPMYQSPHFATYASDINYSRQSVPIGHPLIYPYQYSTNSNNTQVHRNVPAATHPSQVYVPNMTHVTAHSYPFIGSRLQPQQTTASGVDMNRYSERDSNSYPQQPPKRNQLPACHRNMENNILQQPNELAGKSASNSLSNPQNPRFNLYKNLCGLFPRNVVEDVMNSHPDTDEPKRLIKLCLGEN